MKYKLMHFDGKTTEVRVPVGDDRESVIDDPSGWLAMACVVARMWQAVFWPFGPQIEIK